jgi:hypothetical protein
MGPPEREGYGGMTDSSPGARRGASVGNLAGLPRSLE